MNFEIEEGLIVGSLKFEWVCVIELNGCCWMENKGAVEKNDAGKMWKQNTGWRDEKCLPVIWIIGRTRERQREKESSSDSTEGDYFTCYNIRTCSPDANRTETIWNATMRLKCKNGREFEKRSLGQPLDCFKDASSDTCSTNYGQTPSPTHDLQPF